LNDDEASPVCAFVIAAINAARAEITAEQNAQAKTETLWDEL